MGYPYPDFASVLFVGPPVVSLLHEGKGGLNPRKPLNPAGFGFRVYSARSLVSEQLSASAGGLGFPGFIRFTGFAGCRGIPASRSHPAQSHI